MTTIGYATLQIIPSLKGVTEAIDKDIDGKVVSVSIAPKVDQAATKKTGQEAGATIAKEAKDAIRKEDVGKAIADDVTTSVKRSSPGKLIASVIVDGLADGVKQGLPRGGVGNVIVDGIADGIKQGIETKGLGTQIVGSISRGIKDGDLGGSIKDAVLPGIAEIGTQVRTGAADWSRGIADSLRSGDIQGATNEIAATVTKTTDIIASIGTTFGAQTDGIRDWGQKTSGIISTVGDTVQQSVIPNLGNAGTAFDLLEGKAKISSSGISSALAAIAIPEALYEILNGAAQRKIKELDDAFWKRHDADDRARDLGLKPEQPGIGEVGGPAAVGQGDRAFMPVAPHLPDELRTKVAAGQLPGFSLSADGVIIGSDGKPVPLPGHATGGQISGPGTAVSDSILLRASVGEFIVNAAATRKNLPLLEIINSGKLPGFAGGGLVTGDQQLRKIIMERFGISDIGGYRPADKYGEHSTGRALDVMVGGNKAKGDAVKDFALANASAIDLKWAIWRQHLYYPGGGGYDMPDRGSPTQNHMDHVHIFSGTGIVNGLRGALAGGPGVGMAAGVGVAGPAAAGGPGAEDTSSSDQTAAASSSSASGGGAAIPASLSGLSTFGLGGLGVTTKATPNSPDRTFDVGKAASAAVGGQVSSALGVFGVGDSPGWLQGISTLVGGISVSDKSGKKIFGGGGGSGPLAGLGSGFGKTTPGDGYGGAAPVSAASAPVGPAQVPNGTVHGSQAGQQPGPVFNTSISAFDTTDAFTSWEQQKNLMLASKVGQY